MTTIRRRHPRPWDEESKNQALRFWKTTKLTPSIRQCRTQGRDPEEQSRLRSDVIAQLSVAILYSVCYWSMWLYIVLQTVENNILVLKFFLNTLA